MSGTIECPECGSENVVNIQDGYDLFLCDDCGKCFIYREDAI